MANKRAALASSSIYCKFTLSLCAAEASTYYISQLEKAAAAATACKCKYFPPKKNVKNTNPTLCVPSTYSPRWENICIVREEETLFRMVIKFISNSKFIHPSISSVNAGWFTDEKVFT
jgi:hypothetical protein